MARLQTWLYLGSCKSLSTCLYGHSRDALVVYSLVDCMSGMHIPLTYTGVIVYVHIWKEDAVTRVTGLSYMGVCM